MPALLQNTRERIQNSISILRHSARTRITHPRYDELKVFCIGRNKTGTTTLQATLQELGFTLGDQRYASMLADDHYHTGNFDPIIRFCAYANAFQDAPFSWPDTYRVMDSAFPNALFILSVRDSAEQWYESLIQFHANRFGHSGHLPTPHDLQQATYIRRGYAWRSRKAWASQLEPLYDRDRLISTYNTHNEEVKRYFSDRPGKLITINVSDPDDYSRLCDFLGVAPVRDSFPWENRT